MAGKRRTREHIFPKAIGYFMPVKMACGECNNGLSVLDEALTDDHWVRLAQGRAVPDATRSPHLGVKRTPDGKLELLQPYRDKASWRAVGKVAFEALALMIQENVFRPSLDNWRNFVRYGKPDLTDHGTNRRWMIPTAIGSSKPIRSHIVTLDPFDAKHDFVCVHVNLFGTLQFMCVFEYPYARPQEPRALLTIDLDSGAVDVWTQPDMRQPPQHFARLSAT